MDIGANPTHDPPYLALMKSGFCELQGFEPQPEAYEKLESAKQENETYYPYAIGSSRPATFHVCKGQSFSSIFPPSLKHIRHLGHWGGAMQVSQTAEMKIHALDDVPDLSKPDFLKMDVQGAELEILEGGQNCLSDAIAIMPEIRFFRLYEGEPMFGELDTALRNMGFMLVKILPGATLRITSSQMQRIRPAMTRSQMIDADAIYIRDMVDHRYCDEQLKRLAILCDGIFDAVDITLRCLDLLVEQGVSDASVIDQYIDTLPANFRVPTQEAP